MTTSVFSIRDGIFLKLSFRGFFHLFPIFSEVLQKSKENHHGDAECSFFACGGLLKIESIPSPTALQSKIQKPGTSYANPMKQQHRCCSLCLAVHCDCSLLQNESNTAKMRYLWCCLFRIFLHIQQNLLREIKLAQSRDLFWYPDVQLWLQKHQKSNLWNQ